MDPTVRLIQVPLEGAMIALILPLVVVLLTIRLTIGTKKRRQRSGAAANWSVPSLDRYADGSSFFHTWDPRVKIGVMFSTCFLIVSLHHLSWCAVALLIALLAVHFCRIPWQRARRRLLAMAGFLAMFLIVVPFTSPTRNGETLLVFPFLTALPFHLHGLYVALAVALKACTVALLMEPMLGTSPLPVTLEGMRRLGLPGAISQMILLSHRYIHVFLQEIIRMHRSMRVRGFVPRSDLATMRTMGNFFGMLFIRSFERTQQVYEAMLSRGYQGAMPTYITFTTTGKDLAKGGLWIIIGVSLLLLDRLAPALLP